MRHKSISLLLALLLLVSCESPKAPTFVSKLKLPLNVQTYNIFDLQEDLRDSKDSVELIILSDSVLIEIGRTVDPIKVEDNLKADPTTDSTDGSIENDLDIDETVDTSVTLGYLAPDGIDAFHGQTTPVPAFGFPGAAVEIEFDSVETAGAVSGTILITLFNGTTIPFDTVLCDLVDSDLVTVLASFQFLNLQPLTGQTRSYEIPYDPDNPVNVNNPPYLVLSGHSPGTGTNAVLVDTTDAILLNCVFDLTCRNVTGTVKPQYFVRSDSVKSTSNSLIEEAIITSGQISLSIVNNGFQVPARIRYTSADFIRPDGTPLADSVNVSADSGSVVPIVVPLGGYKLRPQNLGTPGNQRFYFDYTITTAASTGPVMMQNEQGVRVFSSIDTIRFSEITGRLINEEIDVSPRSEKLDIEAVDSIQFQNAYLEVITEHAIQFPITLDLDVVGKKNGSQRSTQIAGTIQPYTGGPGGSRRDTIRSTNSAEVAALLSLLPDSIVSSGVATIGDALGNYRGTVTSGDSVTITVAIRAPLVFSLPVDSTRNIIKPDPKGLDMGDKIQELVSDNFESVAITGTIANHFPVGVEVQFMIDTVQRATEDAFYDSAVFRFPDPPLKINKGTTNAQGIVTAPTVATLEYFLDRSMFEWIFYRIDPLTGDPLQNYQGLRIRLMGSGATVKVTSTDYVGVNTQFEVEFRFDEDVTK
jgi:hypothetical protein